MTQRAGALGAPQSGRGYATRPSDLRLPHGPVRGVPATHAQGVHWVEPVLVGAVAYGALTRSGRLRHPVWQGWRPDLTPDVVGLEDPDK